MQLGLLVLRLFLGVALTLAVQFYHRRLLTPDARARAWNTASWAAAVVFFGPYSMVGWGWVTTGRWWGVVLGAVCAVGLLSTIVVIDSAVAWLLGVS